MFPVALDRQQRKFIVALSDTNNIVAIDQLRAHPQGRLRDRAAPRRRVGDRARDRALLRPRVLDRRHPARDRDRRGRLHHHHRRRRVLAAGGAPDLGAARRRGGARRLGHPLRAGAELPAHPLPDRRRAAPDPLAAQDLLAGDGGAPEGDGEDEHRRDARAAGRANFRHHVRPRGGFQGREHADDARREPGAAHPRSPEGHRAAGQARDSKSPSSNCSSA